MCYNAQIIDKFNIVEANIIYGITKIDLIYYEIILKPPHDVLPVEEKWLNLSHLMDVYIKCW